LAGTSLPQERVNVDLGSIHGRLLDSVNGTGIAGGQVALLCFLSERPPCIPKVIYTAHEDGGFEFDDVVPGKYGIVAWATGFVTADGTPVTNVEVKPNVLITAEVGLDPEAHITGTVVDENRKPVPQVQVTALRVKGRQLTEKSKSNTTKSGEYSLDGLAFGKYYVRVQLPSTGREKGGSSPRARGEVADSWIYYPSAFESESAAAIHLQPGQTQAGVTIRVRPRQKFRVSGKIVWGSAPALEGETPTLSLSNADGLRLTAGTLERRPDATNFDFRDVPVGRYTLQLVGSTFSKPAAQSSVQGGKRRLIARDFVDVGTRDIDDFVLHVPDPIRVVGRLVWHDTSEVDNEFSMRQIHLSPILADSLLGAPKYAQVQKDGTFILSDCDPLRYVVHLSAHPGSYVQSMVANGQDRTTTYLDLSSASSVELIVTLHKGGASVSGMVNMPPEQSHRMRVTLIPSDYVDSSQELPFAEVKEDGTLLIDAIRPGSYHAVVLPDIPIRWDDPELARAIALRGPVVAIEDVHVDLQLRPVSAQELDAILDSSGSSK
jgi:hypothetical protein